MRRGPFNASRDGDYYHVEFDYCSELISFIKSSIPRSKRWWDPSGHCWTIHGRYIDRVTEQARYMGFNPVRVEQGEQPPPPAPHNGDAVLAFVNLLSFEALSKAYKQRVLEVHPDRPEGDVEAMKKLNTTWDEVRRRFGK